MDEEEKKVQEKKEFMLQMVDKYDLYFGNRGLEGRIGEACDINALNGIAREMDDLLMADPRYRANTDAVCSQIDNPWVNPNQRINYPRDYFTMGRSSRSQAKYGNTKPYSGKRRRRY